MTSVLAIYVGVMKMMNKKYISRYKLSYSQIHNLVGFKVMSAYQRGEISFNELDQHLIVAIQEHNKNE